MSSAIYKVYLTKTLPDDNNTPKAAIYNAEDHDGFCNQTAVEEHVIDALTGREYKDLLRWFDARPNPGAVWHDGRDYNTILIICVQDD